jgi:hypothetical protein
MICPKCGSQQDQGQECKHCGVIFARFHKTDLVPAPDPLVVKKSAGPVIRVFRLFGWIILACLIIILILLLRTPSPPQIEITTDDVENADVKVKSFQSSMHEGRQDTLQMNESELNSWLSANLALNQPHGSDRSQPQEDPDSADKPAKTADEPLTSDELQRAQSSVHDVKAELAEDSIKLFASFDFHGKDMLLELDGRILVQDGYLRLAPTGGRLGSLPLPSAVLERIMNQIFDSPQNKEKFKLPPGIRDITIKNRRLTVASR